jgi:endonuclease III
MTTPTRAAILTKTHKLLKRSYKHNPLKGDQPLLESLLFACCLENARHDLAQTAYAKLRNSFFDWNEIRVSTVKELAEVLDSLPEPSEAAARFKGILQSVFESDYSFELEHLKKQNIGAAVKRLQKLQGVSSFAVAYATQTALGGHSIPVDKGTLGALFVLGVIGEAEAQQGIVPGMERAIPKSKGHEFGALLHELGADFFANPFSTSLRDLLQSIAPDAKQRFPKRASKKLPAPPAPLASKAAATEGKKKEKVKEKESAVMKKSADKSFPVKRAASAPEAATQPKKKPAAAAKKTAAKTLAKRKPR